MSAQNKDFVVNDELLRRRVAVMIASKAATVSPADDVSRRIASNPSLVLDAMMWSVATNASIATSADTAVAALVALSPLLVANRDAVSLVIGEAVTDSAIEYQVGQSWAAVSVMGVQS